jgi:hypothetical protein
LNDELVELDAQLDDLTAAAAPTLRAINGVGAQVATALLAAAGDNPDRLRTSWSFAALCGVSPIDASSGRQRHHRLNRYGDRQANWALHVIIISRLRWHPPTQAYMARRLAEGPIQEDGHALPHWRSMGIATPRRGAVPVGDRREMTTLPRRLTASFSQSLPVFAEVCRPAPRTRLSKAEQ